MLHVMVSVWLKFPINEESSCRLRAMSTVAAALPTGDATVSDDAPLMLCRVSGKKVPGKVWVEAAAQWYAQAALSDEMLDPELGKLPAATRTKNVHYTHGRSGGEKHVQPDRMSRQELWEHLLRVYEEAYPEPSSPTKSILAFGLVAQEPYPSLVPGFSPTHKHAICFATEKHYWSKVAKLSREKYGIYLNAVAHTSYVQMYEYVRKPSRKKQLCDLDAMPFYSPMHPRGDALRSLLLSSGNAAKAATTREPTQVKRERAPDVFQLVRDKRFRTVTDLRAYALEQADGGHTALAEWCTRRGAFLKETLDNAWDVLDAAKHAAREKKTRMDILQDAEKDLQCVCSGKWQPGAEGILRANSIEPKDFAVAVCKALSQGAVRRANVACVGRGGCGKSSLLEPLELIFECAEKPQGGSSFPFATLPGCDVMLWQDYEHDEGTVRFSDLLALLVGEAVGLRLPGRPNTKYRNTAPLFYSGRSEIACSRRSSEAEKMFNAMMDERFTVFKFTSPLPMASRKDDWPKCGKCAAAFYAIGAASSSGCVVKPEVVHASGSSTDKQAPSDDGKATASSSSPSELTAALKQAADLHTSGALTSAEFTALKAKLLAFDR